MKYVCQKNVVRAIESLETHCETYCDLDKMAVTWQMRFSNVTSWKKHFVVCVKFSRKGPDGNMSALV